ncbi:hypothetical protein ACFQAV_08900 [Companilactobacillus huachuanensis]|uniref:DUF4352 domain-containing protein n=1 Tax=Companilactobacillus huachuanensis TaxID=2559914 RepID=A0ABW1RNP5_9LACO|nr:hypothetical protein [Companilactobacillus huachuanensis]
MRKVSIIVPTLLLGIILTGCSFSSGKLTNTSTKGPATAKIATSYYQSLSKADKKKIKFKFAKDKDETKDNQVGETFVISVKITNDSEKIVKFDKSKFVLFESETHKIPATKTGIASVKPGKSITINQLIENVGDQALVGNDSYFIYMNMDNKLAKTLTVASLAKPQDNNDDSSEDTQQTSDTDTSSDDNQQEQNDNNNQQSQSNTSMITDPRVAYQQLVKANPNMPSYDEMTVTRGEIAWGYSDSYGESWAVYDDGRVKFPGNSEPIMPGN